MDRPSQPCSRGFVRETRRLQRRTRGRARKWADLAYQLAKDGYCRDAEVYVRKVGRIQAGLSGHVRAWVKAA